MSALLKLIPLWAYPMLALVILLGVQTLRLGRSEDAHAAYVNGINQQALTAEKVAREIEQQRQADIEKVRTDAQKQKALDDAAAAKLLANGQQLRDQTTKLLADRAALNTRLAARGKTIGDLTDLLAQLRGEADDYAGQLATALTASRRAGFACQRSFDALRTPK